MIQKYMLVLLIFGLGFQTPASAAPTKSPASARPGSTTASPERELAQLLDRRNAQEAAGADAKVAGTDAEIRRRFERPYAIMITDMTGFTRRTQSRGIISFLGQVRRLKVLAEPIIAKHGAWLIKMDADDLFIAHKDPKVLMAVARDLQIAVHAHNAAHHDDIGLSVGLGYGPTLAIGNDVFGNSVNTASKLGEDTGKDGDILASGDFVTAVGNDPSCTPVKGDGEISFPYFRCH